MGSAYINKLVSEFSSDKNKTANISGGMWVEPLSNREFDVLRLLATELSGPEIAEELVVALSTVRYHTNNIYTKLSVHNRRQAVQRAVELGII